MSYPWDGNMIGVWLTREFRPLRVLPVYWVLFGERSIAPVAVEHQFVRGSLFAAPTCSTRNMEGAHQTNTGCEQRNGCWDHPG